MSDDGKSGVSKAGSSEAGASKAVDCWAKPNDGGAGVVAGMMYDGGSGGRSGVC